MPHPAARPLRVLFVCANDFREASAKQALWFAQELSVRGHSVMMSITGDVDSARGERSAHARIEIRAHRFHGPRLASADIRAAAAFAPDVIHLWSSRLAAVAVARRYAPATGAPVVVHWEDDEWRIRADPMGRSRVRRALRPAKRALARLYPPLGVTMDDDSLHWISREAAGLDALTPALAGHVSAGVGLPCSVILPVTPTEVQDAGEVDVPWSGGELDGAPVALWTGSVHPGLEADVRAAMRAVAEVQARGHDLVFVHVGDVLRRYDPAAWAQDAGLRPGTARFLGYVPYLRIPALLRRASILLSSGAPNDYNRLRLPSKVQAYLASGTPTITFATGFGALLRDREEALLVTTAEPGELADRMVELLSDPGLRARLAHGGPAAARRLFDAETNTGRMIRYYGDAIAGTGRSAALAPDSGTVPAASPLSTG